jgi:membrane-associated phospholipid phosphatase
MTMAAGGKARPLRRASPPAIRGGSSIRCLSRGHNARIRLPLRAAAAIVIFSRAYIGLHYPGEVLVGAAVGALIARATSTVARWLCRPPR